MFWLSFFVFFFFKQKTAYEMRISDWSSDVCSSDLPCSLIHKCTAIRQTRQIIGQRAMLQGLLALDAAGDVLDLRNEVDRLAVGAAQHRDIELDVDREIGRASCRERVCQYV